MYAILKKLIVCICYCVVSCPGVGEVLNELEFANSLRKIFVDNSRITAGLFLAVRRVKRSVYTQ